DIPTRKRTAVDSRPAAITISPLIFTARNPAMTLAVVTLAAGKGSRMKSDLPKVLHKLAGKPMLAHVLQSAAQLPQARLHVVIGHGAEAVKEQITGFPVSWALQAEQKGTGHAVAMAMPEVAPDATVLVLYGDVPLI